MASESELNKVPESVYVGPYRYDVTTDRQAAYDYGHLGVCLYRSRRISLDPLQSSTELPQTLLHEILHALGNAYGIDEWSKHKQDSDGKITDKIDLMASAILVFLRSNLPVVRYLQETE